MSRYMYEDSKLPPYLPMPKVVLNYPISNTAKLLYLRMLGKAQLSQKNRWWDEQKKVYFIYPINQMAVDMNKCATTIKDAIKELVEERLLEKIPQGRGQPNRLYLLLPDDEVGWESDGGNPTRVGRKTVQNYVGNLTPSKYKSKNNSNPLRDYDYDEKESF